MAISPCSIECLVEALSFEVLWAYYLQSSGLLFKAECKKAALQFLSSLAELSERDPKVEDPAALMIGEHSDVDDILRHLKNWAENDQDYPYEDPRKSRFMLWVYLAGLKGLLTQDMGIRWSGAVMSSQEYDHSERVVRWKDHLPQPALHRDPDQLVRAASTSPTIVVVGDIRRSQDLMTYSPEPEDFSRRMVDFIGTTRQLIEEHDGFFDKFTGDGFLAYFNKAICREDHLECFLSFVREELAFCSEHFAEWSRKVRKLPDADVGLAIGADLGSVGFHDLDHHLVAVGDTIVWASRMASIGAANEIVINNLLFAALEGKLGLRFQRRSGKTKAGENFLARVLILDDVRGP